MTPYLEQTWRWFGPKDLVTLADARQAGATGIVSALHHVPCGEVWTEAEILKRKAEIEAAGLRWSVVESVPVHEDLKQRTRNFKRYEENYRTSLRNLGKHLWNNGGGPEGRRGGVVCYNFMAVTDWTRTNLAHRMPTGAEALRFDATDAALFDLFILQRPGAAHQYSPALLAAAEAKFKRLSDAQKAELSRTILLGLPGTVDDLTVDQFRTMLTDYQHIDSSAHRAHHTEFLKAVIPTAEEFGIRLAIHPDDPPFPMFGLPRIAGTEADLRAIVDAVPSPSNGLTFCSGSLGAAPPTHPNNLPQILRNLGDQIHFLHFRSVRVEPDGSFYEDDHLAPPPGAPNDMTAIMRETILLMKKRGQSLPMRPDHGHRMLTDLQRNGFYFGYSAIGRLKGLAELRGLELGLRASL